MPNSNRPGPLTAVTTAVREGRLRALDVVDHAIASLEQTAATLNDWTEPDFAGARAQASAMDRGELPRGPLAGAPLLIKDLEAWQGHPTRKGSLATSESPEVFTSPTPAKLQAAGAIAVAKSTLPEFAIEGFTANLQTGVTRNPWQPDYSPGGSSGGSASAIAAGSVAIATATDGGGSVRIPAALCGLVGLKPTNGVIGRWPAHDWLDYSTDGPFAVSSDDLRLLFSVMRGPVAGDPTAPTPAMQGAMPSVALPRRAFAARRTSPLGPLPVSVDRQLTQAVDAFEQLFETPVTWMEPEEFFPTGDPDLDWFIVCACEHVAALGRAFVVENFDQFHIATQGFLRVGLETSLDDYLSARRRRYDYVHFLDTLLGTDAVLLTPTVASDGWLADGRLTRDDPVASLPPHVYSTAMQNIVGNPALSVPFGHLDSGLPFGFQVTAPHYYDDQLLAIADSWQSAFPWARSAPGYVALDTALGL